MPPRPQRDDIFPHQVLIPELGHCGRFRYRCANPDGLGPHRHPGCWELTIVLGGRLRWRIGGGIAVVPPGHAVWTRPGEVHGGLDRVMDAAEAVWVQVRPARLPSALRRSLADLRRRVFRVPEGLAGLNLRILDEHRSGGPTAAVASRAALHLLLLGLVAAHDEAQPSGPSPVVARALALMDGGRRSVAGAARAVGLSPGRLRQRCLAELGAAPAACVVAARIDRACAVLADGGGVAAAAQAAGYATRAHFANVFRRRTGLAPAAWRQAHRRPERTKRAPRGSGS